MQKSISFKKATISFSDIGKGTAVVLLHGFLENTSMWKDVIPQLSKRNRIIAIDLLGHGKSDCLGYVHSMELFAESVAAVLKHLRIRKCVVVGHSLGGYVALAFAEKYPQKIKGICLMNATSIEDDAERKTLRLRANKMIQKNFPHISTNELLIWACKNGAEFFNYDQLGSFKVGSKPGVVLIEHVDGLQLTEKSKVTVLV